MHAQLDTLSGAGIESIQANWEEMFGVKEDVVVEEVKVKKPRKKVIGEPKMTVKPSAKSKKPAGKKATKPKDEVKSVKSTKKKPTSSKVRKN